MEYKGHIIQDQVWRPKYFWDKKIEINNKPECELTIPKLEKLQQILKEVYDEVSTKCIAEHRPMQNLYFELSCHNWPNNVTLTPVCKIGETQEEREVRVEDAKRQIDNQLLKMVAEIEKQAHREQDQKKKQIEDAMQLLEQNGYVITKIITQNI